MIQRLKTWWATAVAWWRNRSMRLAAVNLQARVAALEETVRKMSDVVLTDAVFTKKLVTRKVTVVDETGQERGTLMVEDDGTVALLLIDENDYTRVSLSLDKGQPEISLSDADGKVRVLMVLYGNIPAIHVLGDGSAKASLGAHNDTVGVIIHDKDGKTRGYLTGSGTGPCLVLLDAEGKPVFTAPPDGDSGWGGLDLKKVFGGV